MIPKGFYDMFKCRICGFHSSWRSCVTRHIREKHKEERKERRGNVVRIRKFVKDPDQQGKSPKRNRERKYRCEICPFRSIKSKALQFHMNCHKPSPDKTKCPYCPYYVRIQRLLDQHIKLHSGQVYADDSMAGAWFKNC